MAASFVARSYSTLSPVSTGMGDRLRASRLYHLGMQVVTKPTRSTQPCVPKSSTDFNWLGVNVGKSPL